MGYSPWGHKESHMTEQLTLPLSHWGPSLGEMSPYAESSSTLCPGESAPFFSTDIPQKLELRNMNAWNQSIEQPDYWIPFLSPFLVFLFFKCQ